VDSAPPAWSQSVIFRRADSGHTLVAALGGLLQRCGLPSGAPLDALLGSPWKWAMGLGAVLFVLALGQHRGPGR